MQTFESEALSSLSKHADAIRAIRLYQAIAAAVLTIGVVSGLRDIEAAKTSVAEADRLLGTLGVVEVAWSLDSSLFVHTDEYHKKALEPALQLAILQSLFLAYVNTSDLKNPTSEATASKIGQFAQRANRYGQALRQLSRAAARTSRVDDLSAAELALYADYLEFEETIASWSPAWTSICKLTLPVLGLANEPATRKHPANSIWSIISAERSKSLLAWGGQQLIRTSEPPGNFTTVVEAKQLDIDSSIKLQAARDKTITHFGTLSGFGPLFPYTFENQPRVKAEWIRSTIISALRKENVESIGALRKKRNDEQFNYERLIGAQKVPLFSIGSDIPAAFLGWLLPAISIALLVVAAGHRRQLVRVCERLHLADQDRLTLAETWSHNPFRQSGWSRIWRALLDGVGLFSLAIVGITVHLAIMQGVRSTAAAIVAVVLLGAASASAFRWWSIPVGKPPQAADAS